MDTPIVTRVSKRNNTCPDCGVAINRRSVRCVACANIAKCKPESERAPVKNKTCPDCGAAINASSKRCVPCGYAALRKPKVDAFCPDCGIGVTRGAVRCPSCARRRQVRSRAPQRYCIDCHAEVGGKTIRCKACHWQYKRAHPVPKSTCVDCGATIQGKSTRCMPCWRVASRESEAVYHATAEAAGIKWLGPPVAGVMEKTWWECPNGHKWQAKQLNIRHGTRCPECQDYLNGARLSGAQRMIHELVGGILNYRESRYSIDVALLLPLHKIAIEYDCYYWHGNRQAADRKKTDFLIGRGWKVLRIKTTEMLPSAQDVQDAIYALINGAQYQEVVLPDWGTGNAKRYDHRSV